MNMGADHLFQLCICQVVFLLKLIALDRQRTLQLLNLLHSLVDLAQTNVQVMLLFFQVRSLLVVQFHLHIITSPVSHSIYLLFSIINKCKYMQFVQ